MNDYDAHQESLKEQNVTEEEIPVDIFTEMEERQIARYEEKDDEWDYTKEELQKIFEGVNEEIVAEKEPLTPPKSEVVEVTQEQKKKRSKIKI